MFFSMLTAAKCFTCMDRDTCPKLRTIYHKDSPVYKGARNQTFQECCKVTPPTTRNCSVCLDQSNITIICSEDVGAIEPETLDGQYITNVQPRACMYYMNALYIIFAVFGHLLVEDI